MTKIFKKFKLSLVLAAAGFTALSVASGAKKTVSAEKESYSYVSLGDSMTTGFGFDDYYVDGESAPYAHSEAGHKNVRGFLTSASESYPALIKEELSKTYDVDWKQMAANAARIDDIYYNISGDTNRDEFFDDVLNADVVAAPEDYTWNWHNEQWNEVWGARALEKGLSTHDGNEGVVEAYQNAIKAADLVTLNAGFNNFGCFITGKLNKLIESATLESVLSYGFGGMDSLKKFVARNELDIDVDAIYAKAYEIVAEQFGIDLTQYEEIDLGGAATIKVKKIVDVCALAFVSYCYYMNATTKIILELNPDVELVVLGLYNNQRGMVFTYEDKTIDLGEYFSYLCDACNTYVTLLSEKADAFKYVVLSDTNIENHFEKLAAGTLDTSEKNRLYEGVSGILKDFLGQNIPAAQIAALDAAKFEDLDGAGQTAKGAVNLVKETLQRAASLESISIEGMLQSAAIIGSNDATLIGETFAAGGFDGFLNLYTRVLLSNGIWSHPSAEGHQAIAAKVLPVIGNDEVPSARMTGLAKVIDTCKELYAEYGDDVYALAEPYIEEAKAQAKIVIEQQIEVVKTMAEEAKVAGEAFLEEQLLILNQKLIALRDHIVGKLVAFHNYIVDLHNQVVATLKAAHQAAVDHITYELERIEKCLAFVDAKLYELHSTIVYGYFVENVEYVWADDNLSVQAIFTFRGVEKQAIEEGVVVAEVIKEATLDEVGVTKYSATFNHAAPVEKEVADIEQLTIVETTYDWALDGSSCTASLLLSNGETIEEEGEITSKKIKDATLEAKGQTRYTAEFEHAETSTKVIADIPQLTITSVSYKWADDKSTCTATYSVSDGSKFDETVNSTSTKVAATLESAGSITYKAHFSRPEAEDQTAVVSIAQLTITGVTYKWSSDYSTCTATYAVSDGSTRTETVNSTSKVAKKATLDAKGETEYTAHFTRPEAKDQKVTVADIAKLTVAAVTYKWASDCSSCTATLVLSDGSKVVLEGTVTQAVTKEPTLEAKGETTYTATFTRPEAETQTKTVANIAKLEEQVNDQGQIETNTENLKNGIEISKPEGQNEIVVVTDEITIKFDASASSSIPAGAELKATVSESTTIEGGVLVIELSLTKDGAKVNFDGTVTVSVPYTDAIPEGKQITVYYVDGENLVKMETTLENGVLSFTTSHFSTYVAVVENIPAEPATFPAWAIAVIAGVAVVAVVIIVIAVSKKSPKKEAK